MHSHCCNPTEGQPTFTGDIVVCRNTTIRVQTLLRVTVDLVSLSLLDYGSLSVETLAAFENEMLRIGQESRSQVIVLDLGHRKRLGAGFLHCLARLREVLTDDERKFVVCGDDGGIFNAAGWGRLMRHYPNIAEALNGCAALASEDKTATDESFEGQRIMSEPQDALSKSLSSVSDHDHWPWL